MKRNLIFLTTAITRGNLHEDTIGKFYNHFYKHFENFNVYHVINIDCPLKLKNIFNVEDTKSLFQKIIPKDVNKIFLIDNNDPGFGKAFKNVLETVNNMNLLNDNSLVWWLEDDWDVIKNYNVFNIINNVLFIHGYNALNFTSNTPLCSFRAGPIMNSHFFKKFFDISKKFDIKQDPEYKVGKSIRHNLIVDKYNNIYITCLFISSLINPPYSHIYSCTSWYKKRFNITKFNENCGFKFILAVVENPDSPKIKYNISENPYEYQVKKLDDLKTFKSIEIKHLPNLFVNSSINYFNIVPFVFEDVGRKFNKKFNIQK